MKIKNTCDRQNGEGCTQIVSCTDLLPSAAGDGFGVYTCAGETPVSFNTVRLQASSAGADRIVLEIRDEQGQWQTVYDQDELGERVGVLDRAYAANEVRAIVYGRGHDAAIRLQLVRPARRETPFRIVAYCPYSEGITCQNYDKLDAVTDLILLMKSRYSDEGEWTVDEQSRSRFEAGLKEIRQAVGDRRIDLWLYLGNPGAAADKNRLFCDPAIRQRSIDLCLELVSRYDLCGADIDYEYPETPEQWANYGVYLRELGTRLRKKGKRLSAALSPWEVSFTPEVIESIDYVNVMAYDLPDEKGRHSGYRLAQTSIAYFEKLGFLPSQLVLGLAFYGVSTKDRTLPHSGHPYARYMEEYNDRITVRTNQVEDIYFTGRDMNRDKTFLGIDRGLSGVFYWHFCCDIPYESERSLLRGVEETVRRFVKRED